MEFIASPFGRKMAMALVVSSVLVISACGGGSSKPKPVDPPGGGDPVVPPTVSEDLTQVISGTVFNQKSGAIVSVADLAFKEGGAAATNIRDIDGNTVTSLTTSDGSFEVTIAEGASITGFTIVASSEGFLDQSLFVAVAEDAENISTQIELAPAEAVANVATTQAEATVADATAAEAITVNTDDNVAPDADTTVGNAQVVVGAGTQLQDVNGNAVDGTSVSVNIAFVEEAEDSAPEEDTTTVADSIPAGLNSVVDEATADSVSVPLVAATVNVTTNTGADVKNFSSPITITFNMPATTFVRSLNRTVQAGDSFAVKSFDEDTGVWAIEPNNAVVGAANGSVFPAAFEVDHLTTFAVTDQVPVCNADTTIVFAGDAVPANTTLTARLISRDVTANFSSTGGESIVVSASAAKTAGISASLVSESWVVTDTDRNQWGTLVQSEVVCGSTVTISLTNPVPETVDETLQLTAVCSNDTTVTTALSGALVKYRLNETKPYRVGSGNGDGTYSLVSLLSGESYAVLIDPRLDSAESSAITGTITADGTTETIEVAVTCSTGTGAG